MPRSAQGWLLIREIRALWCRCLGSEAEGHSVLPASAVSMARTSSHTASSFVLSAAGLEIASKSAELSPDLDHQPRRSSSPEGGFRGEPRHVTGLPAGPGSKPSRPALRAGSIAAATGPSRWSGIHLEGGQGQASGWLWYTAPQPVQLTVSRDVSGVIRPARVDPASRTFGGPRLWFRPRTRKLLGWRIAHPASTGVPRT